ncbi:MAG TPA: CHAT domain-containing protein [Kofleriaceae bacterium]|nr:CHAT domain-containing protein [Kofleriaceae bacterium]
MMDCARQPDVHALADGELAGLAAEAARDHVASCATCQAELADVLQLAALPAARLARVEPAIIPLAWYRRRAPQLALATAIVAAAACALLVLGRRAPEPAPRGPAIALGTTRQLEARISWGDAAAWRAYDVPRAGEPAHEAIPLTALAEAERAGDAHGVGVLALLDGERAQAASYLDRAGATPDVLADRAALALADGQPERALALADAVLAQQPDHTAALWNRGLALRDLGLGRGAAAAFRAVAAHREPGWADEASRRAAALDAETDALEQRFDRLNRASVSLAGGALELTIDDARAEPGYARGILYDAIRSAPSRERLAKLRPLADAIDAADGDTALADALDRAAAGLHPELATRYGELVRALSVEARLTAPTGDERPLPTGAARPALLGELRAAHADDLLLGVLMKLGDNRRTVNPDELAEFARLAQASPDPWMQMLGLQEQAQVALDRDDLIGAEAILLRARQRCAQGAPAFRCITIGKLIGNLYLRLLRLPEARAAVADTWLLARRSGEWFLQGDVLQLLAQLALVGDDSAGSTLPLLRAYTDEVVLRFPKGAGLDDWRCQTAAWSRTMQALDLVDQLQMTAARRELAGPACKSIDDPTQAATALYVRAVLAEASATPADIAALRADIAALRASPGLRPSERILLDHAEGRALIDRDPATGEALLRRAITEARALPSSAIEAHRTAAWSYAVLAISAARHGDGDATLGLLGEEQGLAVPHSCVLGLAVDDQRRAFAARDAAGKPVVRYDEERTTPAIDGATLVPADISAALAGCPAVDVIARPPIHGMARLFGEAVAWRYLSRRAGPVGPPGTRRLVIADVAPPAALDLPHLQSWPSDGDVLSGPEATPSRVLAAIGGAGEVTIHAHGLVDVAQPDASYLALSPDPAGKFALTTGDVRRARFATSPLVVLAACRASQAAPVFHDTWSLPAAFVYAGARAVIASAAPIPDADAAPFFDAVRARVRAGAAVAIAVRDVRRDWLAAGRGDWVRDVIVFE